MAAITTFSATAQKQLFALVEKRVQELGGEMIAVRKSFFNGSDAFVVMWKKTATEYVTHQGNLFVGEYAKATKGKLGATFYLGHYHFDDVAEKAHASALADFAKRR